MNTNYDSQLNSNINDNIKITKISDLEEGVLINNYPGGCLNVQNDKIKVDSIFPIKFAITILSQFLRTFEMLVYPLM